MIKHLIELISRRTKRPEELFELLTIGGKWVPAGWGIRRILFYNELLEKIANIEGAIVECGVGFGNSLSVFSELSKRKIYGFDTFSGFPYGLDYRSPRLKRATLKRARKNIGPAAILTRGIFEETLPKYKGNIVLLHLDCDLYRSYKTALQILLPRVVKGGIIAFDEYENEKYGEECRRAVHEFFSPQEIQKSAYTDKFYVVKK